MKWIATSSTAPWCEKVPQPTEALPQLFVTDRRQQAIDGFGGCFNEIGWQALEALSEDRRTHVLRDLFDPAIGCGYRLCRVPVGANDYALEWYSHNECDGDFAMKHFSIERDRRYLIPYVRAAMSIQPDLRLFASPWSPPTWMKQPRVYNYGVLRWEPEILESYALYLLSGYLLSSSLIVNPFQCRAVLRSCSSRSACRVLPAMSRHVPAKGSPDVESQRSNRRRPVAGGADHLRQRRRTVVHDSIDNQKGELLCIHTISLRRRR